MNKLYILSFDHAKSNAKALHNIISHSPGVITDWWHWLGSTYIIVSPEDLLHLHREILKKWPSQNFLLLEINLKKGNYEGLLPSEAWNWIRKYHNDTPNLNL